MGRIYRQGPAEWPVGMIDRPPHRSWREYLDCLPKGRSTQPVPFDVFDDYYQDSVTDRLPDIAWARPGALAFSEKALSAFAPLNLEETCRIAPIEAAGTSPYYLVVPDAGFDILDQAASHISRYKSSGRISHVKDWRLFPVASMPPFFRVYLEDEFSAELFMPESTIEVVTRNGLTGLRWREIELSKPH